MQALALVLVIVALGCSRGTDEAAAAGPVYTPLLANHIRGLAPRCAIEKQPAGAVRVRYTCDGDNGRVTVALGAGDRVQRVDVALRMMTAPEARTYLKPALGPLAGPELTEQLMAILERLASGQHAEAQHGGAKLVVDAGGTSKIAAKYTVALTW